MLSFFRLLAVTSSAVGLSLVPGWLIAQEKVSRSILSIEESDDTSGTPKPILAKEAVLPSTPSSKPVALISSSGSRAQRLSPIDGGSETVRDRYANGKLRVERAVTLDAEGNYTNHGDYREYSDKGDLLVTGSYQLGQRTGVWAKFMQPGDAKLLTSYPFSKLRAPFTSTVEFEANEMNGVWVIADRDKRVACQIQLSHGVRHGTFTLFHPNGQTFMQAEYSQGVLNGMSFEKNTEGKLVREDHYTAGQRQTVETEHYNNKSVKSVMRYLTAAQQVVTSDNWETTTLASYAAPTSRQLHGDFVTYHENGQVSTKGAYVHGKLNGIYESWYRTGEVSATGAYVDGVQSGDWIWRHANGMKRALATYADGKIQGEPRAWDEQGKAVSKN
ncbi:MAG: hypothetical protein IT423_02435 [Pirellulaceae bacterium]|nr:hypothetical protein [Pirellulaceae bacterium]